MRPLRSLSNRIFLASALLAALSIGAAMFFVRVRLTTETQAALDRDEADGISFGRAFIANPDLPHRLEAGVSLNKPDPSTFYAQGPAGYVDYPAAEAQAA